ncbi:MAG: MgtC/SapB family protein [Myxococcales bacterium]
MEGLQSSADFPHVETIFRIGLAIGLGLFVGLEREWRHKEAGLRTFGFAALLGALGGLLGPAYALLGIALLGILVGLLAWHTVGSGQGIELTTSAALLITGYVGVLAGLGHTFTPVAVTLMVAGLLAWKEQLAGFSLGISAIELRAAILLAILAFVVYPILPQASLDPWGLIQPRAAWVTVILIAAIGFANYILLKMFGTKGVQITGFLGGLVNSTVTVTELATRARESHGRLSEEAYRGVLLATCAMAVRNAVLLGIVATTALFAAFLPIALILVGSLLLAARDLGRRPKPDSSGLQIPLQSPFSLQSALKFGLIFLVLQVVGKLAETALGQAGFYAISLAGGVVSSASAVASAGILAAQGHVTPAVAGVASVLASLASATVNLVLVARIGHDRHLTARMARSVGIVVALGIGGALVQSQLPKGVAGHYGSMLGAKFSHLTR